MLIYTFVLNILLDYLKNSLYNIHIAKGNSAWRVVMRFSGLSILFLVILVLLVVQSIGGFLQIQDYRMAVRRMHRLGNVGIGQKRGKLLNGHIALIACNSEGIITGAEVMDGIGVWSRFHKVDSFRGKKLIGSSIFPFLAMTEGFSKKERKSWQGYVRALEALEVRITDRELTREQEEYMEKKNGRKSHRLKTTPV